MQITKRLREVLDCVDVRAVDHIIVGAGQTVSLSETGKM
ncbi:MAG: hypothetical protein IBX57_11130 [Gammaproteobacteria bacterium]|nr:hypothetical protein [Gammaproteobacteria bacterium]